MEERFNSLLTGWRSSITLSPAPQSQGSPRTAPLDAGAKAQIIIAGARSRGGIPSMTLGSEAAALLHPAPGRRSQRKADRSSHGV